ncbi:hypothetical protein AAES_15294 [Amazona aestiva]|uniref:Uncharacterized protein n=1 Tax=Amazona aestiva TaxID=12930 RepID=A0A0Q3X9P6_AMAAE|nr:hypothetical protein AAES_15294 [Amazona aestiva]
MWSLEKNFCQLVNGVFGEELLLTRMWSLESFCRLENVVFEEELLSTGECGLRRTSSVYWRVWSLDNFCRLKNVVFGELLLIGEYGLYRTSID